MKYSMMSYTLARYKDFDIKKMFELTVKLKMDGLDMVSLYGKPAAELRKMADDFGVKIVCHTVFPNLNFASPEERKPGIDSGKKSIEDAVTLGTNNMMFVTPGNGFKTQPEQMRKNWIAGLKELMPLAKAAGVRISLENFPGADSPMVTSSDFFEFQKEIPDIKLTFDNGNAAGGEDPVESYKKCAPYLIHAHFKDWDRAENGRVMTNGEKWVPALIGEGIIDQKACLKAMKEGGYDGCINIEYEGNKYQGPEAVERAVNYLRSIE